jgi:RNA polymerase-binding transcription factor DksA
MDSTYGEIRQQLQAQLDRLVHTRHESSVSVITERPERSGKALRLEVAAIQSALTRLENGTYENCSKCGKPIDARRLVALPTTATCLRCSI